MEPTPQDRGRSRSVQAAWLLASVVIGAVYFFVGLGVGACCTCPAAALASTPVAPAPSASQAACPEAATTPLAPQSSLNPSSDDPKAPLDGEEKSRRMLEPRVWSGRASVDEVKMLRAICRHQKDDACVSRATGLLKQMTENQ